VLRTLEVDGLLLREIAYSPTLVQYVPVALLEELHKGEEASLPIFSGYRRKGRRGSLFSTLAGVKVSVDATSAGCYSVSLTGEADKFGNLPVEFAEIDDEAEACFSTDKKALIEVADVLESPTVLGYVAVNGKEYEVIHLPRAVFGRVVYGFKMLSDTAVVVFPRGRDLPQPGEVVEAYFVYAKSGRGDFMTSGTSHQLNVYRVR
jgi:hypothetical protein